MPAPRHTLQQLEAALLKHGSMRKAAAALGYRNHSVLQRSLQRQRRAQAGGQPPGLDGYVPKLRLAQPRQSVPVRVGQCPASDSISLADLRKRADPVGNLLRIVAAFAADELRREARVAQQLGFGRQRWRKLLQDARAKKCVLRILPGCGVAAGTYIGRPADVAAARNELDKASYL